ncbi:GL13715 [Drosophila persimilis]|uniref:GL13715 n=1 Tax=Drosophila persimilis TaxID=7234 RepID=B4GNW1_DROPE|nr:GL13715 [Drosophila persimilis]
MAKVALGNMLDIAVTGNTQTGDSISISISLSILDPWMPGLEERVSENSRRQDDSTTGRQGDEMSLMSIIIIIVVVVGEQIKVESYDDGGGRVGIN